MKNAVPDTVGQSPATFGIIQVSGHANDAANGDFVNLGSGQRPYAHMEAHRVGETLGVHPAGEPVALPEQPALNPSFHV